MIQHPFPPLFDKHSKLLVLGSFPSVKSREEKFFYGHTQNRFWKVISSVFGCDTPASIQEKRDFLLEHNIALWDLIAFCEITGSADNSIKNVIVNNLDEILSSADIKNIYINGRTAEKYYNLYLRDKLGISAVCLPSTSPANAKWSTERLINAWSIVKDNFKT